jgi:murein DD-endopeptidase MepM/ murein hydrolase activator NlpD
MRQRERTTEERITEDSAAGRRFARQSFCAKLKKHRRVLALAAVLAVALFCFSRVKWTLAVRMDGSLIGYVEDQERLDAIVERVTRAASDALGYSWKAPTLTCHLAFAPASAEEEAQVVSTLYQSVKGACSLELVYVDGEAVCAFPGQAEAMLALEEIRARYLTDNTVSAAFLQEVTLAQGYASTELLEENLEKLAAAVQVETVENYTLLESYPSLTEKEYDETLFEDEEQVLVEGSDGEIRVDCSRTLVNGEVWEKHVVNQTVLSEPVNRVVLQGTRPRLSTGTYIWPFSEQTWLSSKFGYRGGGVGSSFHRGIDLAGHYGDPVLASDGGVVIFAGVYSGYGLLIEIQHDNGDVTYYAHNSKNLVSEGDIVYQGDVIAEQGATGVATGVHVHFELHPEGGAAVDPIPYLPEEGTPPLL